MPDWQTHPQSAEGYLWIMKPRRVFVARVNMAMATYPTAQITFDNVTTGAYTDLQVGMTVLIGTSEGAWDLGRTYVRAESTTYEDVATSSVLNIGYSSRGRRAGEVELLDNAYITVLDLYEMWERPAKAGQFPNSVQMDYDLGSSGFMPPVMHVGNTGGLGTMGFVDGDDVLEVDFDGSGAYTVSPDAPDWFTNSKEYDVGDGTITSGTSLDDAITVEFPPGYRWVTRRGFDEVGRSAIPRRFCVMALETSGVNAPLATAYDLRWSRKLDGQVLTAQLKERLDPADYPPGTVVMLLVKQAFNGVEDTLGGWECKFAGWLDGADSGSVAGRVDVERGTTIRAVDVAGRLKQIRRAPSRMERAADAAHPYQMESATAIRYLWWELVWHTWAPAFSDIALDLTNGDNYPFTQWSTSGGSCWAICDNLAMSYGRRLTCDSRGRLQVIVDPMRQEEADRTSTVQAAITESAWTRLDRKQQPEPPVGALRGSATLVSTTNAADVTSVPAEVFGIAPGRVKGRGAGEERLGYPSLARSATEFWKRLGQDYARRNNPEQLLRLTLAHGADGGIEPALLQWVTVTAGVDTVGWTDALLSTLRGLPVEVQFALDDAAGVLTQAVTVEPETIGTIAEDDPQPVAQPPRVIIRDPVFTPPSYGIWVGSGTDRMALLTVNGVARTTSFQRLASAGGPVFTFTSWATIGVSGQFLLWVPNGFQPGSGWVITSTHVYSFTIATLTAVEKHEFDETTTYRSADASFAVPNHFVVTSYIEGVGTKSLVTFDNSTFTEYLITANYSTTAGMGVGAGCLVSSRTPGLVLTSAHTNTAAGNTGASTSKLWRSLDGGISYGQRDGYESSVALAQGILSPFHDNAGDALIYYGAIDTAAGGASNNQHLFRNAEDISPSDGTYIYGLRATRDGISASPLNRLRMLLVAQRSAAGVGAYNAFLSDDGGDAWAAIDTVGTDFRRCAVSGDDPNTGWLWGVGNAIAQIGISGGGATQDSRTGNLASLSVGEIIAIAGY